VFAERAELRGITSYTDEQLATTGQQVVPRSQFVAGRPAALSTSPNRTPSSIRKPHFRPRRHCLGNPYRILWLNQHFRKKSFVEDAISCNLMLSFTRLRGPFELICFL